MISSDTIGGIYHIPSLKMNHQSKEVLDIWILETNQGDSPEKAALIDLVNNDKNCCFQDPGVFTAFNGYVRIISRTLSDTSFSEYKNTNYVFEG